MRFTATPWIGQDSDGEPQPYLGTSDRDIKASPIAPTLNDLFNLGMEGEDVLYLLPTDCYFQIKDAKTIALYKTSASGLDDYLLEYTVSPEWLVSAKKYQSFVWVLIGEEQTGSDIAELSYDELVERYAEGETDLFLPRLYRDFQELLDLSTCELCGQATLEAFVKSDYYFLRCTSCDKENAGANWQIFSRYLKGQYQAVADGEVIARGEASSFVEKVLKEGRLVKLLRL